MAKEVTIKPANPSEGTKGQPSANPPNPKPQTGSPSTQPPKR